MRGSIVGIEDGLTSPKPGSWHGMFLELLDNLYASCVIAPLVVCYWRGTWNLMGEYIYPSHHPTSLMISLAFGVFGHLVFNIFQGTLRSHLNADKHRLVFYVVSRIYTEIYGTVCVNTWRGGWELINLYTTHNVLYIVVITPACVVLLALVKGLRNITASPFFVVIDCRREYFTVPTYFKLSGSKQPGLYILDCMFSVLVIGSLVVFVWRGLWVLLDMELFPEDKALSAWASVLIGYGVTAVTFSLQPLMRWTCDRLTGIWRVIVADLFLFFSFIATINVWRGVWQLLDYYFLPENRLLSNWITHVASLLLLILLNCSNSVLVRGVYIDAEEPAGQCVVFPVYYIRLFFQKERTKKQKKILEALNRTEFNNVVIVDKKPNTKVEQNHQINRNLDAVPLTIVANPKSNGDHNVHENKQ
uniref:Putative conserved plasma membrane protein n=1 Tax=Culex tarsalis TaxID=7177 RepID=A0A1Q3FS56_CULTA